MHWWWIQTIAQSKWIDVHSLPCAYKHIHQHKHVLTLCLSHICTEKHPHTYTFSKCSKWAASPALWNILHPTCLYNSLSTSSSWSLITLSLYPPLGREKHLFPLPHWNLPDGPPLWSSMILIHSEHQRSASDCSKAADPTSTDDFKLVWIINLLVTT